MKKRAAVIGVGYLGRFHAQKYKALSAKYDFDFIGVCDGRPEVAQAVAQELGVQAFNHPQDLLKKVDFVTIAASTQAHYPLGKMFLEAGIHINLEKPLAATTAQARELVSLAKKNKLVLSTGHIERFNPAVVKLRQLASSPAFIEARRHTAFRARGADVSVMHDLMIHDLDLVLWMTGSKIKSCRAFGQKIITTTYDTVDVFLDFENGAQAHLSASRVSGLPTRSLRVVTADKTIDADLAGLQIVSATPVSATATEPLTVDKHSVEKVDALELETQAFIESVLLQKTPQVTGQDGLLALESLDLILKQLEHSL